MHSAGTGSFIKWKLVEIVIKLDGYCCLLANIAGKI